MHVREAGSWILFTPCCQSLFEPELSSCWLQQHIDCTGHEIDINPLISLLARKQIIVFPHISIAMVCFIMTLWVWQNNPPTVVRGVFILQTASTFLLIFPGWMTCFLESMCNSVQLALRYVYSPSVIMLEVLPNQEWSVNKPNCIKKVDECTCNTAGCSMCRSLG